ncbi:hypothetical protein ACOME3_010169 [Neoechinorhynchus agilis]
MPESSQTISNYLERQLHHDLESKRKERHTAAEQKRRDAIKRGFELLASAVPTCQPDDPIICNRITKANILHKSIAYLGSLREEKNKLTTELLLLKKDIACCEGLEKIYRELMNGNTSSKSRSNCSKRTEETKFIIFRSICDELFRSFEQEASCNHTLNLHELINHIITWIENYCNPEAIKNSVNSILYTVLPIPGSDATHYDPYNY